MDSVKRDKGTFRGAQCLSWVWAPNIKRKVGDQTAKAVLGWRQRRAKWWKSKQILYEGKAGLYRLIEMLQVILIDQDKGAFA